ncbi:MAG: AAA family ATPase [Candidatus Parabeggiatoa sp.]|nr:AAA family ATPase [Candidatus Parabeggiatoa sp.]
MSQNNGNLFLKISHFKSIESLELRQVNDFSVFAGANGSGKSNFFDALDFVSRFMRHGITDALRWHGGFEHIHSIQENEEYARRFEFEIECTLPTKMEDNLIDTQYQYKLIINSLDTAPEINEQLFINQEKTLIRNESLAINLPKEFNPFREMLEYSGLSAIPRLPLSALLRNISIYRIDNPFRAPDQEQSNQDASLLKSNAYNLASVLRRLEQDDNLRETILEWMETVVPSIQEIKTERQNLAINTTISFKEQGRQFPAHLMSDGTIYALSLLVAVLDTPRYGLTLIEEPERGLHPQAIFELIDLIREQASHSNPIWMTTHSESVVRQLKLNELWLVDKKKGRTQMKSAAAGRLQQADLAPLGVDEAWLSNLLGGGLPW